MVAIIVRRGIGRTPLEQPADRPEPDRDVAPGTGLQVQIARVGAPVPDGIDLDQPCAAPFGLAQQGQQVQVADERVLAPEDDRAAVAQIEEIVAVHEAEVRLLGRIARAGADAPGLDGDRPEPLEEVVDEVLHQTERAAAAVVQDGGSARFLAHLEQLSRHEIQRLVPGDGRVAIATPQHRRREPLRIVLPLEKPAGPVTKESTGDRMLGVPLHPDDSPVLDRRHDPAGVGTVPVARRLDLHEPPSIPDGIRRPPSGGGTLLAG